MFKKWLIVLALIFTVTIVLAMGYYYVAETAPTKGVIEVLVFLSAIAVGIGALLAIPAKWAIERFQNWRKKRKRSNRKRKNGAAAAVGGAILSGLAPQLGHCALTVTCAPSTYVTQGNPVKIHVWTAEAVGQPKFEWKAGRGVMRKVEMPPGGQTLEGQQEFVWNLSGIPFDGMVEAGITVTDGGGGSANCNVAVVVSTTEAGKGEATRVATSSMLVPDQQEASGYGLYTYILLGAEPDATMKARVLQVVETYLRLAPNIEKFNEATTARSRLHVVHFPVQTRPEGLPNDVARISAWVVDNYDVARSKMILANLGAGNRNRGPYIVSSLKPVGEPLPKKILIQDLSDPRIHPDLVKAWVEQLVGAAARERDWQLGTCERLALTVTNAIRVAGDFVDPVRGSIVEWVLWTETIRTKIGLND